MDQSLVWLHARYSHLHLCILKKCKESFQFLKCDNQQVQAYFPVYEETVCLLVQNADFSKLLKWEPLLQGLRCEIGNDIFVYLFDILQSCMLQLFYFVLPPP